MAVAAGRLDVTMNNPLVAWAVITFGVVTGIRIVQQPENQVSKVVTVVVAFILLFGVLRYLLNWFLTQTRSLGVRHGVDEVAESRSEPRQGLRLSGRRPSS